VQTVASTDRTGAPGHSLASLAFFVTFAGCSWNLYRAIVADPGFVAKPINDAEIKMVR
jgi:hypothetical protein